MLVEGPDGHALATPTLTIPAAELVWTAVRSSGPGGQNVNRVSTKVELRFDFETCAVLSGPVKARLGRIAAGRLDAEGRIVITSQATRFFRRRTWKTPVRSWRA